MMGFFLFFFKNDFPKVLQSLGNDKRLKTFLTLCLESQVVCRKIFHMVRPSMKTNSDSSLSHQYVLYIVNTIITIELN